MIEARLGSAPTVLLLAPVRGLVADAERIAPALTAFGAGAVGLGLSAEELEGIVEHFDGRAVEPVVPLAPGEAAELKALTRYGEVRVPNPAFTAALAWGRMNSVPVAGVDPGDDLYSSLFAEHIRYVDLLRRTLRERSLTRRPPTPATADEFALAWGGSINSTSGSRALASARDRIATDGARELGRKSPRVAMVVDRERFDGVRAALEIRG